MAENEDPQVLAVKKYLDEQSKSDVALQTLFRPEKIEDCFAYIKEQARKLAVDGCAMVEDSLVYKWARDYYIDELPKKAETPPDVKPTEAPEKKVAEAEVKQVVVEKDGDVDELGLRQLTLFDME